MKQAKTFIILVIFYFSYNSLFPQCNISGYILDAKSKETLIGANIILPEHNRGTTSNEFGYYSLAVNRGETTLKCSFVGFSVFGKTIQVHNDTVINIFLEPGYSLDEFKVKVSMSDFNKVEPGMIMLSLKEMQMLPSLTGEVDVIKALHTKPGISGANEGSASLLVRGGNPDENLILLDDVPLYYTGHLGGFTSIFDESAIKSLKIYKAGFPARYGERISSVLDIRTKDGNMMERKGEIQIGTLVSKISINGPVIKNKTAVFLSLRRSNLDWFLRPFTYYNDFSKDGYLSYTFYDLNVKINHRISDADRIYFSFYRGDDLLKIKSKYNDFEDAEYRYSYKNKSKIRWNNTVGSFRWNHVFKANLFANFTLAGMKYQYVRYDLMEQKDFQNKKLAQSREVEFKSKVNDFMAKADFNWDIAYNKTVKFGTKFTQHYYNPSSLFSEFVIDSTVLQNDIYEITGYPKSSVQIDQIEDIRANELTFYGEYLMSWRNFDINTGLRAVMFTSVNKTFSSLQPRLSVNYSILKNLSVKTSYAKMQQFTHMLSSDNGGGMPSDIWVPVGGDIEPLKSVQLSFGIYAQHKPVNLTWNVDAFYKTLHQLIDFKSGENIFTAGSNWQEKTEKDGQGRIAGFEISVEKQTDKLTSWLGYTWTKNQRKFTSLNNGDPFPSKYERRHDFELALNYQFSKRFDVSATWNYASGIFQTLGEARGIGISNDRYSHTKILVNGGESNGGYGFHNIYIYDKKNNFQYPDFHRLDISFRLKKQKKNGVRTLVFGLINAYNHKNPYTVYYTYDLSIKQKTLFPILPSFSWKFTFGENL